MANEAQNLGLQQVPETDVRSGGQIASSIASSASSGAAAGSVLAPWGTVVGAVVGGGIAAIGQLKGKKREEKLKAEDEQFNEYVERMGNTYGGEFEDQMMVAKNGMVKDEADTNMVEYEDGEIHARPTYDFKGKLIDIEIIQIAPEGIKHEDSQGEDHRVLIPTEEGKNNPEVPEEVSSKEPIIEGDVIFDTQDDDYRARMISDIKAFQEGDETAGKRIMKEIKKLPVDETVAEDGTVIGGPLSTSRTEAKEAEESVMLQNMQQEADNKKAIEAEASEKAAAEAEAAAIKASEEEAFNKEADSYNTWLGLPENEGREYKGYVPVSKDKEEESKSGVSFGAGYDLGTKSEKNLREIGLSEDTIKKMKPYLGLKGKDAVDYNKSTPLDFLTKEEVDLVDSYTMRKTLKRSKKIFGDRWKEMGEGHRKVAMAALHQYGTIPKNALRQLKEGDDKGLLSNLADWKDKTAGTAKSINARYAKYVDLIKSDIEKASMKDKTEVVDDTKSKPVDIVDTNNELEEQNS
jgi:hypothetical protein